MKTVNLKLFGWHISVGREKLTHTTSGRGGNLARRLRELRNRRYRRTKGCCENCGAHYEKHELQMHHVLPYVQFPRLALRKWNLLMLCPRCHYMVHHNPIINVGMMKQTARAHGIDLDREMRQTVARRYDEIIKNQTED